MDGMDEWTDGWMDRLGGVPELYYPAAHTNKHNFKG